MNFVYKLKPQVRLSIGIVMILMGLLFTVGFDFFKINIQNSGFLSGIVLGIGIGLVVTYRKVNA